MSEAGDFRSVTRLDQRRRSVLARAVRVSDNARVVLKRLVSEDEILARAALERECAIASLVASPRVVRCDGLVVFRGRPTLVLEDFGGLSLDHVLTGPLAVEAFLGCAISMAAALADVHKHGVVHCDVKPSNVIVSLASGIVKLSDFGSASTLGLHGGGAVSLRAEATPAYMAPEQTGRMNRAIDARADLYSLGVTFFEMLAGSLPFSASDPLGWMHCHIAKAPPALTTLAPATPKVVAAIVSKLLAKLPEDRYQTALGLCTDLERCRDALAADGAIEPFVLGEGDVGEQFRIPQRLYGREREVAALRATFDHVVTHAAPAILLVSGYAGVGKTSLVRELDRPIARARGMFAAGKFDQMRRGVPYAAVAQAVGELVRQLLAFDAATVRRCAIEATRALGGHARVVTEVVPEVALLVGEQPAAPTLGPIETQARLTLAFHALLRVLIAPDRPVVIFLDDLQWADPASLLLLQAVASAPDLGPLLLVMAYRDNEVDAAHPVSLLVSDLRAVGARIESLVLEPLTVASVETLLADCLQAPTSEVAPLASLVARKTEGNPFFVNEFLKTLYLEALLRFDGVARRWRWVDEDIARRDVTENVVHLMTERLQRMSSATRTALQLAACVGHSFDLASLAAIDDKSLVDEATTLGEAVDAGLITLVARAAKDAPLCYRFAHDRVQQAAYALIEPRSAPDLHLRIGRRLRALYEGEALEAHVFDIVAQLNAGLALLHDPAERADLARLNRIAASKAKASTAYAEARRLLAVVASLQSPEAWNTDYEDSFALHVDLAECAYLSGSLDDAEAMFADLERRSRTDLDRGKVYVRQMNLLQVAGKYAEATSVALRAFAVFGLEVPPSADAPQAFAAENARAALLLRDRPIASLIDGPRMVDPRARMIVQLLEAAGPPIYMVRPELFGWLTVVLLRCSLEYGNAEASCYAYGLYGIICAASLGDPDRGYDFACLAIALNERLADVRLRCCVLHLLGDHVNFWKNPIATGLPILERGFRAGFEGGDLVYSNYIGFQSPWHFIESGARLDDVLSYTEKYEAFALRTKHLPVYDTIRVEQQLIFALKGMTNAPTTFDAPGFSEQAALDRVTQASFACGIAYFHIMKLVQRYLFGDYVGALEAADLAAGHLGAVFSMPIECSYHFFRSLTVAALCENADAAQRAVYVQEIQAFCEKLRVWSAACPSNFADKLALMCAEHARIEGSFVEAFRFYEISIVAARKSNFLHIEALANELAGRAYAAAGVASVGILHTRRARGLYRTWGANAKVVILDKLVDEDAFDGQSTAFATESLSSHTTTSGQLDLLSVAKAAQTLSSEIVLPRVLDALMRLVAEHAGAQRGYLLLADGESLLVAAVSDVDHPEISRDTRHAKPVAEDMPLSILNYVRQTHEHVIIGDASIHNTFSSDPYLRAATPRSILCLPIARKGHLAGLLYLENNRVTGAFSRERLAILDLLAAQAGISIENARLYKASQDAVKARDEFLRIASHELKTPLASLQLRVQTLTRALGNAAPVREEGRSVAKLAEVADRQIVRLTRVVESLLDVSRIRAGNFVLVRQETDLTALIASTVASLSTELAAAACTTHIEAAAPVLGAWDAARLQQVVSSLLLNAMKFGAGKSITVRVSADRDTARIAVRDLGIGIASEHQATIFDRFERIGSSDNIAGLGLGLFLGREVIAAHGGTLTVDSAPGEGATFTVSLPRREEPSVPFEVARSSSSTALDR